MFSEYRALVSSVPEVRLLWPGSALSSLGDALQFIAIFWLAASANLPGLTVAAVVLALSLPTVLMGPWLGTIADMVPNRRHLLVMTDLARAAITISIPLQVQYLGLWALGAAVLLLSSLSVLFSATYRAAMPELVGESHLNSMNGLLSTTGQVAFLAGTALGGFLINVGSSNLPFLINGITFLISGLCIRSTPLTKFAVGSVIQGGQSFVGKLGAGAGLIRRDKEIRLLVTVGVISTAGFAAAPVALVVLVTKSLSAGPTAFGFVQAVAAAGLVVGSMLAGARDTTAGMRRLGLGLGFMAASTAALAIAPALWIAMAAVLLRSTMNGVTSVTSSTLLQRLTSSEIRGRIMGFSSAANEFPRVLILPIAGVGVDLTGPRPVFLVMAFFIALAGIVALRNAPGVDRRLTRDQPVQ